MSVLHLDANSLLSKWGFGDGDLLNDWWWDTFGEDFPGDKHDALCDLVETVLLPVLAEHGYAFEVQRIGTIHNPIRLASVNGQPVDWYDGPELFENIYVSIAPEVVRSALASRHAGPS